MPVYRPRDAEHTVLHQVISAHLETFLNAVAEAGDGSGRPRLPALWGTAAADRHAARSIVIRKLLAHLGLARSGPIPGPAPPAA